MSDLISKSALLREIDEVIAQYNWKDDGVIMDTLSCVRDMISDADVAYNVDKVVEELEKKKDPMKLLEPSWLSREEKILRHNGYCEGISDAIEIVRRGGDE